MRLSIVVPACNEELRIRRMLDAYLPYFSARYGRDVELLVVVNGSTDRTAEVVQSYRGRFPQLRLKVEPRRVGKGGALMQGFAEAGGELVGFVDADGATPPEAFDELVTHLADAGAVIASRWRRDSVIRPKQPLVRRVSSRVFHAVTRFGFGLRLTDTQCGAKLMRREALMRILPDLGITQWAFDVDLLVRLQRAGYRIKEIPTTWSDQAGSKVEIFRASVEMLAALARLRLLYSPLRWVVALYDRLLGPFIHPPGLEEDRLFRHSLLLLAGAQMSNVFNVLFQAAMARMLAPSEYGIMAAMLGLAAIAGAPVASVTQAVAHHTAMFVREDRRDRVNALLRRTGRDLVPLAALLIGLAWAASPQLARFFRLADAAPVMIMVLGLVVTLYGSLLGGALSGAQAFIWGVGLGIAWSSLRLFGGLGLTALRGTAVAALCAHALAGILSYLLTCVGIRKVMGRETAADGRVRGLYTYLLGSLATGLGYAFLMNADVAIVKHYFPAREAGLFAEAAMVARLVVFLPMPVAGALFPKVVSAGESSQASLRTLAKALLLVTVMVTGAALMCTAFPRLLLRVLAGSALAEQAAALRAMVWALAPLSVLYVLVNFEVAQRRFRVAGIVLLCAAAYLAGASVWHGHVLQVAAVLGAVSTLGLLLAVASLRLRGTAGRQA